MKNIKAFLDNLSHHPGVYQMLGKEGEVLYVGKAKDLKKRVSSYFSGSAKDSKTHALVTLIKNIDVTITHNENEAVLLECNLIKQHRPRFNILLRDDKSYPYIVISKHEYPRIDSYRGVKKSHGRYFGPYPSSVAVKETINLIQKIFKLRTCRDSYFAARTRPCLLYQIGRCTGPCVELISKNEYLDNVKLAILFLEGRSQSVTNQLEERMEVASKALNFELAAEYRDQIQRLRQIQGRQYANVSRESSDAIGIAISAGVVCVQLLTIRDGQVLGSRSYYPMVPSHSDIEEIISAFLTQHYLIGQSHIESIPRQIITRVSLVDKDMIENALAAIANRRVELVVPSRGNRSKWLAMAESSAKQSLSLHLFTRTNVAERIISLQKTLDINHPIRRIECFDISHSMGEETVASCVVFDKQGAVKEAYRRFNISGISPGDDVAAMKQVVMRRFARLQKDKAAMPELVLIDGGKTQLSAAKEVMTELNIHDVLLVGVSKGPGRKAGFETLHRLDHAPIHLPSDSSALHFIQQIRDEAHRFAITGHRQRRDKKRSHSTLEYIPGIGAKRRRELLRYFGGIQGVTHASLEELIRVPGISRSIAERIFAALHDTLL